MIIVDANLLVYALHADMPKHSAARAWLEQCLNGDEPIALCWLVILAVIRISTNTRLFPRALTVDQSVAVIEEWLSHPAVVQIEPGPRHWTILHDLLAHVGTAENLTSDAQLAALAIEHDARVHSSDADFRLFPGLRFHNPLN